jgi:hypothetical protein
VEVFAGEVQLAYALADIDVGVGVVWLWPFVLAIQGPAQVGALLSQTPRQLRPIARFTAMLEQDLRLGECSIQSTTKLSYRLSLFAGVPPSLMLGSLW